LQILQNHPQLSEYKSLVVDLAYGEYCQREKLGSPPGRNSFCKDFVGIEHSLQRRLEVHSVMEKLTALDDEVEWPRCGDHVGSFYLLEEFGSGLLSRVFLAKDWKLGQRLVVVKIATQAEEEANIIGELSHPNIVPIHSISFDHEFGRSVICMPYLGQTTLADVIQDFFGEQVSRPVTKRTGKDFLLLACRGDSADLATTPLEQPSIKRLERRGFVDAVLCLGGQIAAGLQFAHSRQVLHLDVKPSNILLSRLGVPMLLDFNLSTKLTESPKHIGGTIPYMSPEQIGSVFRSANSNSAVDARADIFSFGVVLYELLSGQNPFGSVAAGNSSEIANSRVEQIANGPIPLRSIAPYVPQAIARFVESCLAFDNSVRPQDMNVVVGWFEHQLGYRAALTRWYNSHRPRVLATGALLASLIASGLVAWHMQPTPFERCIRLGRAEIERHNWKNAKQNFEEALVLQPSNREALFRVGLCSLELKEWKTAFSSFQRLYELEPSGKSAAGAGYALLNADSHVLARDWLLKSVESGTANAATWNDLGIVHQRLGSSEKAMQAFNTAIELDAKASVVRLNRMKCAMNLNSTKGNPIAPEVLADESIIVREFAEYGEAMFLAASFHAVLRDQDWKTKAAELLKRAAKQGFVSPKALSMSLFSELKDLPEIAQLLGTQPTDVVSKSVKTVMNPLLSE
jgi:serine/threonine protein kinase